MSLLPDLTLTGARVLADGALRDLPVSLSQGRIGDARHPEIDVSGYLLLPGIVDLHGDAFERHIAPRPSAPFPPESGLAGTEREAAASGVTTAYLAQSWSWEGGHRGPDYALTLMEALDRYRAGALIDLRLQIRCETHTPGTLDRLLQAVRAHGVGYVVFNDHLFEAAEMRQSDLPGLAVWAAKAGRTIEAHMAIVAAAEEAAGEVPAYLSALARAFDGLGVTYGSHDDRDAATRRRFAALGARVCEFPTSVEAAAAAVEAGEPVLMGAPNVVRSGSQSGNIAAQTLIEAGLCDALVSDYHYPTLAAAAFRLADADILPLPAAWAMISETPARILGHNDRGRIAPGLRADLVLVEPASRRIEATIAGGRVAWLSGEAARRFCAAGVPARAAEPA